MPIHCAAREGHLDIVKLLLDKRADISSQGEEVILLLTKYENTTKKWSV
jgi:ankyrin repeat protein